MRDDSEWSPPSQGIAVKLTTDKAVYRTGEPIALTLTVRNVGGAPWLLRLGPSAPPEAGSPLANAPLYDLSVLTLTQVGGERAWTLGPVPSNMFPVVGEWTVLDPGAAQSAHGRLTTWAWTSGHPATRDRDEPLAHGLGPGKYSLRGHFKASTEIRVGDRSGDDALASLREFFLESDASIEAFRDRGFLGISYADAIRLRGSRYRLWSGELDAPPWEFVVEP